MNAIKAIFMKQMNDLPKNFAGMGVFILWPIMAFVMSGVMGDAEANAAMFAAMLIGSGPMMTIANNVAEDNEYKGLRFLVMAGVKPWQYLIGLAGSVLVASAVSLAALIVIGGFTGDVLIRLLIIAAIGFFASSIMGGAVGIFAKNVQSAAAISTPLMMVFAFTPMFAGFNETVARVAEFMFPYQVLMVVLNPYADFMQALIVTGASVVVLLVIFAIAYKRKGLRG